MNRTRIEYGTHLWAVFTGCRHTLRECPTMPTCWARGQHWRFKSNWARLYNPDFYPRFNPSELDAPRHLKKPARILVAFTGDLFSQEMHLPVPQFRVRRILDVVEACPQHAFVFLTKNPFALPVWNPWPSNAWVGTSITGAETPERQAAMMEALGRVQGAGCLWVSYEPMLGPLLAVPSGGVKWIVMGAQSGSNAIKPKWEWWLGAKMMAEEWGLRVWRKTNLTKTLGLIPRQELP